MPRDPRAVLADLARAFPREPLRPARVDLYLRELADVPPDVLGAAVSVVARTSEFFPTVAKIREAAAEIALGLPGEAEAVAQVEARIRWARDPAGEPPAVHPLAAETLALVGGYAALREATEPAIVRGQWLRLFREARARAVREHAVGPAALEAGARRRELPA